MRRTLVQNPFEVRHLLDVGPGQFWVISHDGSDFVAKAIEGGSVSDEEEARIFELLARSFSSTSDDAKGEG